MKDNKPQLETHEQTPISRLLIYLIMGFGCALVLLLVFVVVSTNLTSVWMNEFDTAIGDAVRLTRSEGLTSIALFITWFGNGSSEFILFLIVGGFLLFRLKHIWETMILFVGVLGAWGLNEFLKSLFQRARPYVEHLAPAEGFSFPSGHAMVSIVFYGLIGYLLWLNLRGKTKFSWVILLLTALLICAIGYSRVYLGVHYPSDVLAGYAAGGVWLISCICGLRAIRFYKSKRV